MTGKIFRESDNIYEDQAKVLCDYYLKKAEEIVAEEQHYEKKIEVLLKEKKSLSQKLSKTNLFKWALAIFIIPYVIYAIKARDIKKKIASIDDEIIALQKSHSDIYLSEMKMSFFNKVEICTNKRG